MNHGGKSRRKPWVHALIVGVLLIAEAHLFTAATLHHHAEVMRTCQIAHQGGPYLHALPDRGHLCPLCQIIRNSSVRPAVLGSLQKPYRALTYRRVGDSALYCFGLAALVVARAPPLS